MTKLTTLQINKVYSINDFVFIFILRIKRTLKFEQINHGVKQI